MGEKAGSPQPPPVSPCPCLSAPRVCGVFQVESSKPKYPSGTDLTLPTTEAKVDTLITSNLAIYNVTSVSPLLYRYFEVSHA